MAIPASSGQALVAAQTNGKARAQPRRATILLLPKSPAEVQTQLVTQLEKNVATSDAEITELKKNLEAKFADAEHSL